MDLTIEYQPIAELFRNARQEGRNFLYEYEVYSLLSLSGSETPPRSLFLPGNVRPAEEELMALPGEMAVLKIVSPSIIHNDRGGAACALCRKRRTEYVPPSDACCPKCPNATPSGNR